MSYHGLAMLKLRFRQDDSFGELLGGILGLLVGLLVVGGEQHCILLGGWGSECYSRTGSRRLVDLGLSAAIS